MKCKTCKTVFPTACDLKTVAGFTAVFSDFDLFLPPIF